MRPLSDSPIARDGKLLVLAYDHGLEHGPTDFESMPATADPTRIFDLAVHDDVTGLAVGKGLAESYYPSYENDVALLAKLNGTSGLWTGEPDSALNWSVDYAVQLGADAVGFTLYGGSNHEIEMAEEFSTVQEAARSYDLPVAMWAYPRGQGVKNDTSRETISYATRQAFELGADIAKIKYPGSPEAWDWATEVGGPMKVVLSGGSKVSDRAFLETVETVVSRGGDGVAVGRNVWQRENAKPMLDALGAVIHDGASVDEALELM